MKYFVYILQSEKTSKRYIGFTQDIEKRVHQHNLGINRATKNRGPWRLIYTEEYREKSEALRREKALKGMKGGIQLKAILNSAGIV